MHAAAARQPPGALLSPLGRDCRSPESLCSCRRCLPVAEYRQGEEFWSAAVPGAAAEAQAAAAAGPAAPGIFVVLGGAVRRRRVQPDGSTQDYFQGTGGVVGALLAVAGKPAAVGSCCCRVSAAWKRNVVVLGGSGAYESGGEPLQMVRHAETGHTHTSSTVPAVLPAVSHPALSAGVCLPGSESAVAEGNSLGKGPLIFHLPQVRHLEGAILYDRQQYALMQLRCAHHCNPPILVAGCVLVASFLGYVPPPQVAVWLLPATGGVGSPAAGRRFGQA